jgi:hypothetical protein
MSWALSCLTFKELYQEIELVTDEKGKQILIDTLQLPYTSVRVELDTLNKYPKQLWAIGKLYAYQLQDQPFIHVDGDVYSWNKFGNNIETADLVGQHLDVEEGHYHFSMQHLSAMDFHILEELKSDFTLRRRFDATNAGMIGGNAVDFFKEYVDRSFYFINKNLDKVNQKTIGSSYAMIYEQYLFSVLARNKGMHVQHFINEKEEGILHLSDFMNRFCAKKYVHLLSTAKMTLECCRELELQLQCDYPEYHERICSLFNDKETLL